MKKQSPFRKIEIGKLPISLLIVVFLIQVAFGQDLKVDVLDLKPGQTLEREMTGAVTHRYKIDVQKDEFLQVRVEQKGIDVELKLLNASGNVLATMDSPNDKEGPEILSYIASKNDKFLLEISALNERGEKGIYTIERKGSRIATAQDKRRTDAERLLIEGMKARDTEGELEIAIKKLSEALLGWRELKDEYLAALTAKQVEQLKEAQNRPDVRPLPVGQTIERQLKGDEVHYYEIALKKGQVLRINLTEKGINSRTGLLDLTKKQILGVSDFGYGYYREVLTKVIERTGYYAVFVAGPESTSSGGYQLTTTIRETATPSDIEQIKAEKLLADGWAHQIEATKESLREAIAEWEQAIPIWEKLGEKYWEAFTYNYLGKIYYLTGNNRESLEYHNRALRLSRDIGDKSLEAGILSNIGLLYYASGKKRETIEYLNQALPLFKAVGDKLGEANIFDNLGEIYDSLGEKQEALKSYYRGLPLSRETGYKVTEANILSGIGIILFKSGEARQGLTYLHQSLELWRAIDQKRGEAATLNSIAEVQSSLGEKQEALKYFNQSLVLRRVTGDKYGEAITLLGIAGVYSDLGEIQKELTYNNQALLIFTLISNKNGETIALNNIGGTYNSLGENQEALKYFNKALQLSQSIEDNIGIAITLGNIGELYSNSGETQKALTCYKQALSIKTAYGDKIGQAVTLDNMGNIYAESGELQEALKSYNHALLLFREVGNIGGESTVLNNLALAYLDLGKKQEALKYLGLALPLFKAVEDKRGEAVALNNMMTVWGISKDRRMAIFFAKQAVRKYQHLRGFSRGIDYENQKSFLRKIKNTYQNLAELLIEEKLLDQAIQVLALYQDQQFFDFKHEANSLVREITLTPREEEFNNRYETVSSNLGKLELQIKELKREFDSEQPNEQQKMQLQKLEAELKRANDDFLGFFKDVENEFTKKTDERDKVQGISDVKTMQATLSELNISTKQKAAALYTLIGGNKFYVLLVMPDGVVQVFESSVDKNDFNRKLIQFYALLQSPDYDPRVLGQELYNIVLKSVEVELKKNKIQNLMWSLDGSLRYIPMAALSPDGEKYLVESYQNVVFTRADEKRLTQSVSLTWTGYGFSTTKAHELKRPENPEKTIEFAPLDFGKDEMQVFSTKSYSSGSVKGEVFSESAFNKKTFLEMLERKPSLVHISSHFRFYPGDTSLSFLLLGDGNIMTLSEMKEKEGLFQGVEMLTLSACDTAAQQPDATGREIDTFAELAQRLGAGSVLASLWAVRDRSTAQLMKGFYGYRQGRKYTKAEALRKVQLDLLYENTRDLSVTTKQMIESSRQGGSSDEEIIVDAKYLIPFKVEKRTPFAHPYYWAPFVLLGNWK